MANEFDEVDPEILAISKVFGAVKELPAASQMRVLAYVSQKVGIELPKDEGEGSSRSRVNVDQNDGTHEDRRDVHSDDNHGDELGISPAGQKWAKRNGLTGDALSKIFSLGIDEIDLVSKSVPGDNKKDRLRSVFLLKGIAAYLSTGVAKFAYDQARETCLHYDAWDGNNFARSVGSISSEVSGSKEAGYTLTARGLTTGAEIVKSLVQGK